MPAEMTPDQIADYARTAVINHLALKHPDRVTGGSTIIGDLGGDSLDHVELAILFETELGVEITDEEIEHMKTVGDAQRLLVRKLHGV